MRSFGGHCPDKYAIIRNSDANPEHLWDDYYNTKHVRKFRSCALIADDGGNCIVDLLFVENVSHWDRIDPDLKGFIPRFMSEAYDSGLEVNLELQPCEFSEDMPSQ
jgi:hypothetical protein